MAIKESDLYKENYKYGLSKHEAKKRLEKYGLNEIKQKKKKSALLIFLSQFNDFIVWVLFAATIISSFLGEIADAISIFVIIFMDAILGFIQEYKTERALEVLKELAAPTAKVIREGKQELIKASELVLGDIVVLETGDRVPADIILIESNSIQSDESILTGESVPVEKLKHDGGKIKNENLLYMGCMITNGSAIGRVIATGMQTEMGKIADMLEKIEETKTPLQEKLNKLGEYLVYIILIICVVVTVMGVLRGENLYKMFLVGVSLAVAAIPEGLPAIVTVSLALGVQKMMKRNALVKKLPAVETLGCTNVICTDKTGTLTQNKMTVRKIYISGREYSVSGEGYDLNGVFLYDSVKVNLKSNFAFNKMMECSVLCNNADIEDNKFIGDPTEIALLVLGAKSGYIKKDLSRFYSKVKENPFDSNRKMMSVIVSKNGKKYMYLKGAAEAVVNKCKYYLLDNNIVNFDNQLRKNILMANDLMAKKALRVLALAYKEITVNESEDELIFIGLCGMIDPPREEVFDAVLECKMAGIIPIMITGDHKLTAEAIAREIRILGEGDRILTGDDLDKLTDNQLEKIIKEVKVFARVNPSHKYKIVKAYKKQGLVVAMTGDGVNDAPAIKEADIGIAMGITGTDVTKETASLILMDDNFTTIVSAVKEGRIIYDNIRKFIRYLLSCNLGEVLTMFLASILKLPIPLLPIQILLVNLATDGFPAMALSLEKGEADIMQKRPRHKNESIFSDGLLYKIMMRGTLIGLCTITSFAFSLYYFGNIIVARTIALGTLILSQLLHVFECRSERKSVFELGIFTNLYLVYAVVSSLIILLFVIYIPFMQKIFYTRSLNLMQLFIVIVFSSMVSIISSLYWYKK
ncbi:Calcium-transporting ATPase [Caloramator mitchellensis]|uniref:P-type Ca(2+) transporter n=1 Tax=Caloramator mitchellensis TaxID=908809 RepID=A0A0R3JT11_CALMK|nr:calcium-translocating P-type ATPase, SERCA-type [Caloramator mitchellensis]KRQ86619.1 Calcium-transporting ATPase [Caloramator mitchellensis]